MSKIWVGEELYCVDGPVADHIEQLEDQLDAVTKWQQEIMAALPCGYIPNHTPENAVGIIQAYLKELADLQEWKDDVEETHEMIMKEPCDGDDRLHCTCVPALRRELEAVTKERDEFERMMKIYANEAREAIAAHEKVFRERDEAIAALKDARREYVRQADEQRKPEWVARHTETHDAYQEAIDMIQRMYCQRWL